MGALTFPHSSVDVVPGAATLDFSSSGLTNMSASVFARWPLSVRTLVLASNALSVLRTDQFVGLAELQSLDLAHNPITSVEPVGATDRRRTESSPC